MASDYRNIYWQLIVIQEWQRTVLCVSLQTITAHPNAGHWSIFLRSLIFSLRITQDYCGLIEVAFLILSCLLLQMPEKWHTGSYLIFMHDGYIRLVGLEAHHSWYRCSSSQSASTNYLYWTHCESSCPLINKRQYIRKQTAAMKKKFRTGDMQSEYTDMYLDQ